MAEINTDDLTTHIIEANKSPKELKARKGTALSACAFWPS